MSRIWGGTPYQSNLNPICICLASRVRVALPKVEGTAELTISVLVLFRVTDEAFMTLLKPDPEPPLPGLR